MSEPWGDDYRFPDIGEGHEHLLIGSRTWEEKKMREADSEKKNYSIHPHIARAVRDLRRPRRIVGHDETTTGPQLHHTFTNYAEIVHALTCLLNASERDYDRYIAVVVHEQTEENLAESSGDSLNAVRLSLSRARRLMARTVREYLPD